MTVANEPSVIHDPVPLGVNGVINVLIHSDRNMNTVKTLTTETVTAQVKDQNGTWKKYTATKNAVSGVRNAYITLASASHTIVGTADLRWYVDGELAYPVYQFDFIAEADGA
ncbi:MAG: hypothetical protein GY851_14660 [bacterium]|nr:hypothetical protein [bacterium]